MSEFVGNIPPFVPENSEVAEGPMLGGRPYDLTGEAAQIVTQYLSQYGEGSNDVTVHELRGEHPTFSQDDAESCDDDNNDDDNDEDDTDRGCMTHPSRCTHNTCDGSSTCDGGPTC